MRRWKGKNGQKFINPLFTAKMTHEFSTQNACSEGVVVVLKGFLKKTYVQYEPSNVQILENNEIQLKFDYNISTRQLEGGMIESDEVSVNEGVYRVKSSVIMHNMGLCTGYL